MLILNHSYLSKDGSLVKILKQGRYGIYNKLKSVTEAKPVFDYILYYTLTDEIWAKQNGCYFIVDHIGNRLNDAWIAAEDWMCIDRADICCECSGNGCNSCYGFGIIPVGGDFESLFNAMD